MFIPMLSIVLFVMAAISRVIEREVCFAFSYVFGFVAMVVMFYHNLPIADGIQKGFASFGLTIIIPIGVALIGYGLDRAIAFLYGERH